MIFFFNRQLKNWVILLFSVLSSDYPQCLTCLMRYPPVPDIGYLIEKAQYLREPKVGVSWAKQPNLLALIVWMLLKHKKNCSVLDEVMTISSNLDFYIMYRTDKKNYALVYVCVLVLAKLVVNVCVIKLSGTMKDCLKNVKIISVWRRYSWCILYVIDFFVALPTTTSLQLPDCKQCQVSCLPKTTPTGQLQLHK